MAQIWKGAPVAAAIIENLSVRSSRLKDGNIVPTLAIVRVGERGDDISYETGAMKRCEKLVWPLSVSCYLLIVQRSSFWLLFPKSIMMPLFTAA